MKSLLQIINHAAYSLYCECRKKISELKLINNHRITYRHDWTSQHYANWEKWFAPYIDREYVNYLEVGNHEGRSAIWFLSNILTHPTAKMIGIDLMLPQNEPYLRHNIALSGFLEKVTLKKGRSEEVLPTMDEDSFDIIYIDGSHKSVNVLADAIYCWQLLKKDGLLLFDDYLWNSNSPRHMQCQYAIDLFLKHFSSEYELLHKNWQVLVRKKV
jgi:hypothetical protein